MLLKGQKRRNCSLNSENYKTANRRPRLFLIFTFQFAIFILNSVLFPLNLDARKTYTMFDGEVEVMADGSRGPYRLGGERIVRRSERIRVDGRIAGRDVDYRIDYERGEVTFEHGVTRGKMVQATYRYIPIFLKPVYRHRKPAVGDRSKAYSPPAYADPKHKVFSHLPGRPTDESDLTVGGSKMFRLSVGSDRDATLNQSLRLNLSGKIGEDVQITGILSDRNLPIQPEGNTRTIADLDQILLRIQAPHLSAGLGDMDVSLTETELVRYERRIKGVTGDVSLPSGRLMVFGASSPGTFLTREISGADGVQGPYLVNPGDRILAGSERVFLDGERLVRGFSQDFVMDYDAGTITFTPRRPISTDSRIVIEAQRADGSYGRRIVGGRGRVALLDGRLSVGATAVQEKDLLDPGPTTPYSLSKPPAGIEALEPDSTPVSPSLHRVIGLDLSAKPVRNLSLRSELAVSELDQDLFSEDDHRFGQGVAFLSDLRFQPTQVGLRGHGLGSVGFSMKLRSVSDRFRSSGRTRGVEEHRRWGVGPVTSGERSGELGGIYRLTENSGIRASYGRGRWGGERSVRHGFSLFSAQPKLPDAAYDFESVQQASSGGDPGRLVRHTATFGKAFLGIRPSVRFASEQAEGIAARNLAVGSSAYRAPVGDPVPSFQSLRSGVIPAGWRYREVRGILSSAPKPGGQRIFSWSSEWHHRATERRLNGAWADSGSVSSERLRLTLSRWNALSLVGDYIHRSRQTFGAAPTRSTDHLTEGRLVYAPLDGAISKEIFYRLSSTRLENRKRNFVLVGRGHGAYTWVDLDNDGFEDEEEFVPDPDGDYSLYVERIGIGDPVRDATFSARLSVDFDGWKRGSGEEKSRIAPKLIGAFSSETSLDADRRVLPGGVEGVAPWRLRSFSWGPDVLFGRRSIRQDAYLFRYGRRFSLRFRYRIDDSVNREFSSGDFRSSSERSLRIRTRIRRDIDVEVEVFKRGRNNQGGPNRTYDTDSREVRSLAHWRAGDLRTILTLSAGQGRDGISKTVTRFHSVGPELIRSFRGMGRIRAGAGWTRTTASEGIPLIVALSQGRRPGDTINWEARADFHVGRIVTASCSYSGRRVPGLPTIHLGQSEVQATF